MINFNTDFAKQTQPFLNSPNDFAKTQEYKNILAGFGEQLLIFGKIAIKAERENIGLAILINELGIKRLSELLDRGIIEFLLWKPTIIVNTGLNGAGVNNPALLQGQPPVLAGRYVSERHVDPHMSAAAMIKYFAPNLKKKQRNNLIKRVRKNSQIIEFDQNPAQIVIEAYENNDLASFGLPFDIPANNLAYPERVILQGLAGDILETSVLAKNQLSSLNEYKFSTLAKVSLERINQAKKLDINFDEIIQLEKLLDLKEYILAKKLSLDQILDIRKKKFSGKFRTWLEEVSTNEDANEISKEYLDAIEDKTGYFDSHGAKFTRMVSMFGLGSIGDLLLPTGGLLGLGLSIFDTYTLESFNKGWSPRLIVDEIKSNISE